MKRSLSRGRSALKSASGTSRRAPAAEETGWADDACAMSRPPGLNKTVRPKVHRTCHRLVRSHPAVAASVENSEVAGRARAIENISRDWGVTVTPLAHLHLSPQN